MFVGGIFISRLVGLDCRELSVLRFVLRNRIIQIKKVSVNTFSSFLNPSQYTGRNMSLKVKESPGQVYNMGHNTFSVPMALFKENRNRLRARLMIREEARGGLVLLQGGNTANHYNTDMEYVFRQESYFHWMFGVTEPGFYGALDVSTGNSILFIPRLPEEYAVWMGKLLTPEDVIKKYNVDEALYVDQMVDLFSQIGPMKLLTLKGKNSDSGLDFVEATFDGISEFIVDNSILYPEITECRVIKSAKEIEVMRYVCKISSEAHKHVMAMVKDGVYEFQAEATFLHYCYFVGGCRHAAYTSICGSGCNGSTLHYGHAAAPNSKIIKDGDMCLFDMGGTYYGYGADITCSFPANGKFNEKQKIVYNAVLRARNAVLKVMQPGISWVDLHILANKEMLAELAEYDIVKGNVDEMLKAGIGAIFQPHGLGHFLGCDVHDVGGYMEYTPSRPTEPGLKALRTARVLEAGMIITVEPGCYFIDELLDKALNDEEQSKYLNERAIKELRGFGGVRIEDDVLVTEHGCENLVNVPRTVEEIEEYMKKHKMEFESVKCI